MRRRRLTATAAAAMGIVLPVLLSLSGAASLLKTFLPQPQAPAAAAAAGMSAPPLLEHELARLVRPLVAPGRLYAASRALVREVRRNSRLGGVGRTALNQLRAALKARYGPAEPGRLLQHEGMEQELTFAPEDPQEHALQGPLPNQDDPGVNAAPRAPPPVANPRLCIWLTQGSYPEATKWRDRGRERSHGPRASA